MASISGDNHGRIGRFALCLVMLVIPALGCVTPRNPVQIARGKCWTKLLGPNPQVGLIAMTRDGKTLAATFYRDPGSRYLDRVLRIFDLDSLAYQTFSLDALAPWAPSEVTSLAWVDEGMTLDLLVTGNQTRLVRLKVADRKAHEVVACPDCIGIAVSALDRVARIDRYGGPDSVSFKVDVGGTMLADLPASLGGYQPNSLAWSPDGSYVAVVFVIKPFRLGVSPSNMAVFSVTGVSAALVGVRDQDGDGRPYWPDDESVVLTANKEGVIRLFQFVPGIERVIVDVNRNPTLAGEIGQFGVFNAQASMIGKRLVFMTGGTVAIDQIMVMDESCGAK